MNIVGISCGRKDAIEKVTGEAKFTVDLVVGDMLEGKILRSPYLGVMDGTHPILFESGFIGTGALS